MSNPKPVEDELEAIYRRCDVSNNGTDNPMTLEEFKAAIQTLIAAAEVRAIQKHIEPYLAFCQDYNGMPYCKNCGLARLEQDKDERKG